MLNKIKTYREVYFPISLLCYIVIMKYIIWLICILFILSGCEYQEENWLKKDILSWVVSTSWTIESIYKDDYKEWSLSITWIIEWKYNAVIRSWNTIQYGNHIIMNVPQDFSVWMYDLRYKQDFSWNNQSDYWERFTMRDYKRKNSLNLSESNILYYNYWSGISIQEICTPDYQEWINHKPKTLELKKWNQIYYLTYAIFDITAPDTVPSKNYNADICFVKNNKIYHISIGNPTQYRKDIIDSLTFL